MNIVRFLVQLVLAVLVIGLGVMGSQELAKQLEPPSDKAPETVLPVVRTVTAETADIRISVHAQGTVVPRTESALVAEVSGRVLELSDSFAEGGFFAEGATLVRIDPTDYELARSRAELAVAQAERRLAEEKADADVARLDWERHGGEGEASELVLRVPQVREAEAALAAAEADLAKAELDVERCTVVAPYAGRVRAKSVDVGGFVQRGAPIAVVYAVDRAEVRLPIDDDELAFIDLPISFRGGGQQVEGPAVLLRSEFAGKTHTWEGRVVRTEGELDPKTRMVTAVVEVEDPYGRSQEMERPPLAIGMFVEAEIEGRLLEGVVSLPRTCMRNGDEVLVATEVGQRRLFVREVGVLRTERDRVLIGGGLEDGERVVTTPLETVVNGMRVRLPGDPVPESLQDSGPITTPRTGVEDSGGSR